MIFRTTALAFMLTIAAAPGGAQPLPKGPETSPINHLILRAARGEYPATAVIEGPLADRLKSITQSSEPVIGRAWRIGQIAQEGCWRVRFAMRQENVPDVNGVPTPFEGGFDLNICEDGDAPLPR